MSETNNSKNEIYPSGKIGKEEEFLPSNGTYLEDSEIKSSVFGKLYIDKINYKAKVIPYQKRKIFPKRKDSVIGLVIQVTRNSLRLALTYVNDKPVIPALSAIMHVSDASNQYMSSIDEYYASGDIIRARIIDAKTIPIQVECKSNDSGVIYSECEKCGEGVEKIKKNLLICNECKHKQVRKTAIDFGNVTLISN